jgi:hypothetical protein
MKIRINPYLADAKLFTMAKAPQGIIGPFIGKAGNVVGYVLNGQAIVRSLPRPSSKPPSPLALNNRAKMKLLTSFLSNMRDFLMMTFMPESRATVYNWYNLAIRYIILMQLKALTLILKLIIQKWC